MKFATTKLAVIVIAGIFSACRPSADKEDTLTAKYQEQYRPQFHFTPDHNWTNDPNGLVYYKGEYHLYYQYNPQGNRWGHMSWGHALSADLLHWRHLPVAIDEYVDKSGDSTMIFSGSAVVDEKNTSGFFEKDSGGIVAIYTSHVHRAGEQLKQHQSIAYSKDNGRTFTRYEANPVLDIGKKDFRDPKVFWYEPQQKWVMAVVIPDEFKAQFYESKNLKEWKFLSEFGPMGDTARIWECPDLVQVPVAGDPNEKVWVLLISNSHPQGPEYVGMQYFVGQFDGKTFTVDDQSRHPSYLEYGKDFYAAITYNNIPSSDGRVILLGWANNWAYAQDIPTFPWKSAMALPRELTLSVVDDRLIQTPLNEIATLRGEEISDLANNTSRALEINYTLEPVPGVVSGLKIFKSDSAETIIGYDESKGQLFFNRTKSGNADFHPAFGSVDYTKVSLSGGKLNLRILVDHSIVEIFVGGGTTVLTYQVFPPLGRAGIELFSSDEQVKHDIKVWEMNSAW